ncbi:MAG: nucleotidyltransferase family protein [Proteobacteria bacterium]|nr:nucleotidyltransferase family protein [Pseudomonadota bacterium]
MKKEEIIDILRNYKNERANYYGIMTIGIFGSTARGEAHEESDVDIVLRIREPDLFMLVGIKEELEERLHRPVDIVTYRDNMNHFLKKRIDEEAVYV